MKRTHNCNVLQWRWVWQSFSSDNAEVEWYFSGKINNKYSEEKNISLDCIWKALVLGHEYHIFVLTKQSNTRTLLCEDFEYGVRGAWGVLHKYSCWRCCSENTRFGSQDSLTLSETRSSGNSKRLNLGFDYYEKGIFQFLCVDFAFFMSNSCVPK